MSMDDWAKNEIEIACKYERGDKNPEEFDYGCACYESAYKAFQSLMEDGHSGMSIALTKSILNKLIDGKPLTPIEDTPDIWNDITDRNENYTSYQCKRMSSLFKDIYSDGSVKYSDIDRIECVDFYNGNKYYSGFISRIVDEMFPITMPYLGGETYKVYVSDFLYDENNGDFDTIKIHYILKPDGEKITVDRYFKESDSGFVEIDLDEYSERYKKRYKRRVNNNDNI